MVAASYAAMGSEERGHLLPVKIQKIHKFISESLVLWAHVREGTTDLSHPPGAANAVCVDINRIW